MVSLARILAVLVLVAAFALALARESGPTDPGLDGSLPIVSTR